MTVHDLITVAKKKLTNSTSRELDGEVLLSFVLNKPKEYLLANPKKNVDPKLEKTYFRLISKRLLGWPVAYLTKHKEFFGLDFYVDKNVLIPRPETEGLVELVHDHIAMSRLKSRHISRLNILDIGTGSGCIIISIAKTLTTSLSPSATSPLKGEKKITLPFQGRVPRSGGRGFYEFFASDISPQAIKVAKKNAKTHKVKINFGYGNLLEPWGKQKFDIIVANLPYGWKQWKNNTSAETIGLKFEPQKALFTSNNGLHFIAELLQQISERKTLPALVLLEFDPRQAADIKKLTAKWLPEFETKISRDLSGRVRYASLALRVS